MAFIAASNAVGPQESAIEKRKTKRPPMEPRPSVRKKGHLGAGGRGEGAAIRKDIQKVGRMPRQLDVEIARTVLHEIAHEVLTA